jgi:hypothetical protein
LSRWPADASDEARAILRTYAEELQEEASRVTRRHGATHVAPAYVREAATTLRLRRSISPIGDVFLAVGPALAGLAGGVGVAFATAPDPLVLDTWVAGSSIVLASVGMLMTGAGIALKVNG